jgi:hypothetical protein
VTLNIRKYIERPDMEEEHRTILFYPKYPCWRLGFRHGGSDSSGEEERRPPAVVEEAVAERGAV